VLFVLPVAGGVDVQTWDGAVGGEVPKPAADVERGDGRAAGGHERFDFGVLRRGGHCGRSVAEELVHVFEAKIGGLGVQEVYNYEAESTEECVHKIKSPGDGFWRVGVSTPTSQLKAQLVAVLKLAPFARMLNGKISGG